MSKSNLMSKSRRLLVSSSTLLLFCVIASAQRMVTVPESVVTYPDTIIYNGKILTMDDTSFGLNTPIGTVAQAMAVRDRKIQAVGSNEEILAMAGPRTDKVDVKGRMVMPGIIDTHAHIHNNGLSKWMDEHPEAIESVASNYSIAGKNDAELTALITETVKKHVQSTSPGRMGFVNIHGVPTGTRGVGMAYPGVLFIGQYHKYTKEMLDKIAPNHPIVLTAFPSFVFNSAMIQVIKKFYAGAFTMDAAGIDEYGRAPLLGTPHTRSIFVDTYFKSRVPELANIVENSLKSYASLGVTTFVSHIEGQRFLDAYNVLVRNDRMPIRFGYTHWFGFAFGNPYPGDFYKRMGDMAGMGNDYFWQDGPGMGNTDSGPPLICSTMESSKETKEGELCGNGPGTPQWDVTETAIANYERAQATHAFGDKGVNFFMDAVEAGMKDNPAITLDYIRSIRLTADHCGFHPNMEQLPRMAKLGMMISCGARVLSHSYFYLGTGPGKYPMKYVKQIAPIRSAIVAGVMPTVEYEGSWTETYFYSAVPFLTRKNMFGNDVSPEEAVDRNTLMKMMTSWPARFVMKEKLLGTLEKGKFADFAVLNGDYFTTPVDKLGDVFPLMTVVGGKVIVLREEFAKELGRSAVGPQTKFDNKQDLPYSVPPE